MTRRLIPVLAALTLLVACTEADVFETPDPDSKQEDNRLKVVGGFCTEHPDELNYPVKILFIVDCSQSMSVTDPPPTPNDYPGRVAAVWDVVQKFRYDPGVSYGVIRFEGAANVATQADTNGDGMGDMMGFVNDLPSILRALNSLQAAGGNTSYQAALGVAETLLTMDMSLMSVQQRARSRYIVIFLTDGLPYPQGNDVNTPGSIKRALTELMRIKDRFDLRELTFHTAYLSVNTPEYVQAQAEDLLKDMAGIGNGTYRNFPNGEAINFLYIDYTSVKRMYSIKDGGFIVFNQNAHPAWGISESIDSDGDGVVDLLEEHLGTSIGINDSDGDGFSDLLEYRLQRSGFDALDPDDADCSLALDRLDRDGDTLLDCEERFIGTSPDLFDTDADGVADALEVRAGTNPVWRDTEVDMDFDGSLNGDEVAWHTNPAANDASDFSKLAYRYHFKREPGIYESRFCYDFEVDNIHLVGTEPREIGGLRGFNDIMVYAGQVPLDDPDDYGTFRVACARVRYIPRYPEPDVKYPPSGVVRFEQKDFKRPVADRCEADEECPHHVCDPSTNLCLAPLADRCDEATPCPHFTCETHPTTGESTCVYPPRVSCLVDDDCPPYPIHPTSGQCSDPAGTAPDADGMCPRRECLPQYFICTGLLDCPDNRDADPDNDDVCLAGYCRQPCAGAYECNPGETCDPDLPADYPPCATAADCAGGDCVDGGCQTPCITANDCAALTDTCEDGYCTGHHCVNNQGGSCAGVPCAADEDCPRQLCDPEVGRCRTQPCLDSRECPYEKCELAVGFCAGETCESDDDCRGERGYTCNELVGEPCDRDIDCPFNFCSGVGSRCIFSAGMCTADADCPVNTCQNIDPVSGLGGCAMSPALCAQDSDCPLNFCGTTTVCINDPVTPCDISIDCPQTFCGTDNTCINNSNACDPATENIDNNCGFGLCSRDAGLGTCDTLGQESCTTSDDCPNYHCNAAIGMCYYPVRVACTSSADCPEAGMTCDGTGFCVKTCNSDADCPKTRCQGRCVPVNPDERNRCTDWFEADRDCVVYGQ